MLTGKRISFMGELDYVLDICELPDAAGSESYQYIHGIKLFSVYNTRGISRAKTIVDVHHGHSGGT